MAKSRHFRSAGALARPGGNGQVLESSRAFATGVGRRRRLPPGAVGPIKFREPTQASAGIGHERISLTAEAMCKRDVERPTVPYFVSNALR